MKLKPEIVEAYAAVGITEAEATCMMINLSNEVMSLNSTLNGMASQIEVMTAQKQAVQVEYDELSSGLAKMVEPDAVEPLEIPEGAPV